MNLIENKEILNSCITTSYASSNETSFALWGNALSASSLFNWKKKMMNNLLVVYHKKTERKLQLAQETSLAVCSAESAVR